MSEQKLIMSSRTIQLMDACEKGKKTLDFEVINSTVLVAQLAICSDSLLGECLLNVLTIQ